MIHLRTLEQIAEEEQLEELYAFIADPQWQHYDAQSCPAPIRLWIEQHYPSIKIEPTAGFAYQYQWDESDKTSDDLPQPIFWIGFTAEQAKHFCAAWSLPPMQALDEPDYLYLATFQPLHVWPNVRTQA